MSAREKIDLSAGGLFGSPANGALQAVADVPQDAHGSVSEAAAGDPASAAPAAPAGVAEQPAAPAQVSGRVPAAGSRRRSKPARDERWLTEVFDPAPRKTRLGLDIPAALHKHYMRTVADLKYDEDFKTDLTEVLAALLYFGPQTGAEMRDLVERWRETRVEHGAR